jgi:hypothetical protein
LRKPNQELTQKVERLIANECARRGGEWQVTFQQLASMVGEKGKVEKLYRIVNYLAQNNVITIERSVKREPNIYRYIGDSYSVSPRYKMINTIAQRIQYDVLELSKRIAAIQDRDKRLADVLSSMTLVGEFDGVYVYSSKRSLEELTKGD